MDARRVGEIGGLIDRKVIKVGKIGESCNNSAYFKTKKTPSKI